MAETTKTGKNLSLMLASLMLAASTLFAPSCFMADGGSDEQGKTAGDGRQAGKPEVVGHIRSRAIVESSGLAASKCHKDVFWTHNDSGGKNFIFAIHISGKVLGRWKVIGAENKDWEDIASVKDRDSGKCSVFIADTGNNSGKKSVFTVYKVDEPTPRTGGRASNATAAAQALRFSYPNGNPNAETLIVHPFSQEIFIITKTLFGAAEVFRVRGAFPSESVATAERVGNVSVPAIPGSLITGGDISPDGKYVVLCDYFRAYEFTVPANGERFEDVFAEKARRIDLGQRTLGEAVAYSQDGKAIYATSEGADSPVIKVSID